MSASKEKCLVCESSLQPHKPEGMGFAVCSGCLTIHYLEAAQTRYEEGYFEDEYRNQYGRSYLEDRESLQQRMRSRLELIGGFSPPGGSNRLLEIGSAAGFFLEEAKKLGYDVLGWEISKAMSDYAIQKGTATHNGDFFSLYDKWQKKYEQGKERPFDLVCAFYVVEHIAQQKALWEALARLVRPGGILALALPSSFGPLMFFQPETWGRVHPKDHFVDFSPQSLKRVAALYGFQMACKQPEGIHPERFPLGRLPLFRPFWRSVQKKLCFSDTFFAIFFKETDPE